MTVQDSKRNSVVEIHFLSEIVSLQEGDVTRDCEIAQLVRPGQLLVSIPVSPAETAPGSPKKQKGVQVRLVAASNCEVSAGGTSVLSTVAGYPHTDQQKEDGQQVVSVSVTPLVTVAEDGMKACLTLYPPVSGTPEFLIEDLELLLNEAGVVQGIDQRFLKKELERVIKERQPVADLVVAHGMQPIHGLNAHLRMEIEMGSVPGKIRGDGSIDFKERRMFVSVEEGQLIATKIKETKGVPGKTVLGQAIPQKEGRDITVRVSEDALYNEEDRTVRAVKAGVVSIVKDNTIKVSSKQTISGDIDFNTGNIYSKNAVEISGSVKQDFVVAVRGDVLIGGDVQSATISSHGNLVVKGGIVGAASNVNIRGDVDLNFIEKGTVHAGGNVLIRKSSYYSTIIADGNITGDQKTKIVGGVLVCSGSLIAGDIGSSSASPASITVGTDVKRFQHYQELHRKVIELEGETALWLQRHGQEAEKSVKMLGWEQELAKVRAELHCLNLIPGSPVDSMSEDFTIDDDAEIVVSGQIFQGTKLRIGNVTRTLALNQCKKRFKIDKNTKKIVDEPF